MTNQPTPTPAELASYTHKILNSLRLPPIDLPTDKKPGKMRGVDFYGRHLPEVMMECLRRYHQKYNKFPEQPLECKTLYQKLFWSKFFVPLPIPTPADKLGVGKFIPKSMKKLVRPAKTYWISDRPNFPSTIDGPDGYYYLKCNHAWGAARKIKFPIEESERDKLEQLGRLWLARKNYNVMGGEWWYSTIKPKIFIEEDISGEDASCPEYKFECIGGEIKCIFLVRNIDGKAVTSSLFDHNFNWLEGVNFYGLENNVKTEPPVNAKHLIEIAKQIAKQFDSMRVDLYNSQHAGVILGELTLCTLAGFDAFTPQSFDEKLGGNWDMNQYFL